MILHGTKDALVPVEQSQLLHEHLQRAAADGNELGQLQGHFSPVGQSMGQTREIARSIDLARKVGGDVLGKRVGTSVDAGAGARAAADNPGR